MNYLKKLSFLSLSFLAFSAQIFAIEKRPFDFVVGVDGNFKDAIAAASASGANSAKRFVIFFPNGEYDLTNITGDKHGKTTFGTSYVSLIGETRDKAIIANKTDTEGISLTATLYFPNNNEMYLQDLTIQNKSSFASASAARQVTVQQIGDKYIFKNVKLVSGQDTYYTNKGGRTYWEGGEIQGTVDFICGDGDVFFEGTNLVMKRSGGYITAAKTSTEWGYVFNNAKINVSNSSFDRTFYLGRSWGHAKTVFLNTTMYAEPYAGGWGPDMNSAPAVFGEYNSRTGDGWSVNTSSRKTYFAGGKDASTAITLKTVWNKSDAAKYTLQNVLGGSDSWDPQKLTMQMPALKISQDGSEIIWEDLEDALCYAIFVNGKFAASVATNTFDLAEIPVGAKVSVRAANSMGGLGATSNEIAVVESNVKYFSVNVAANLGGKIITTVKEKIAENKIAEFTAKPNTGFKFKKWSGKTAAILEDATNSIAKINVSTDIELTAEFVGDGFLFEAEEGKTQNVFIENNNLGFSGEGFVNFAPGVSSVEVPIYTHASGEYTLYVTYANGSGSARNLKIETQSTCPENEDCVMAPIIHEFKPTTNWTTWETDSLKFNFIEGVSKVTFSTVDSKDGPNLDAIAFNPKEHNNITHLNKVSQIPLLITPQTKVQIFTPQGKFIKDTFGKVDLKNLSAGTYLLKINNGSKTLNKIIVVR